MLNRKLSEWDF